MPLITTYTCKCGTTGRHIIHDWESYDRPSRLPPGWTWHTDYADYPMHTRPVCKDCKK